ncbi:hypothetical protein JYQ31_01115 [Curtobacterium flaccumfaciens pv. flaccumfaciens]|nr:hypothetical protein [Curtobacterium flaccumfaciens pv. flaccumfaciens]
MLKSEFQAHPLWDALQTASTLLDSLHEDITDAERRTLDRVRELLAFSEAVKPLGVHNARRFNPALLDGLHSPWTSVVSSLQNRSVTASSSYTDQALTYAESTLQPLYALWTPPLPPAQQAQMRSFYDGLVEQQDKDITRLHEKRSALEERLKELGEEAEQRFTTATTALETLQSTATGVGDTVDGYEARVDTVVDNGTMRISELESTNTNTYTAWQQTQAERFDEDFAPFKAKIEQKLEEADGTLQRLRETNKEYETLTAAAAANTLAQSFSREARTTRIVGLCLYGFGFVLLCVAAVPLILLLTQPAGDRTGEALWATFAIRAAIGALAASAATVAIRLGSRFVSSGQDSKRTELELRAFGPFLANVDKSESDTARLEFVDRAFGPRAIADHHDESIPVSTFSQILAAVTKLIGR